MTYSASEERHAAGTEGINWPLRQREADGSRNCWDGSLILEKIHQAKQSHTAQIEECWGEKREWREGDGMSVVSP